MTTKSTEEIQEMLEKTEKGWPVSTIDNAAIIMREDSLFKDKIRENMFRERIELRGQMPWNRTGIDVTDKDEIHIRYYIEMFYHYNSEKRIREDTWTGLIQEWFDHTNNDLVCVQQIYNEARNEFGKPRNSVAREIGLVMNGTITGWKPYPNPRNIPKYGKQRGWMRMETNSGNIEETFIPVDGTQMEIPFD